MQIVSDVTVGVVPLGRLDSSATAAVATRVLERRVPSFTRDSTTADADERAYARTTSHVSPPSRTRRF